ncbi:MAG: M3 family metallopeptidase [Pseudomonadales bacterium]
MSNPLLEHNELPPFQHIEADHIEPAMQTIIDDNLTAIDELLANQTQVSWQTLYEPLEEINDRLEQAWSPVSHLNGVVQTEELRKAYETCLPLLSKYSTQLGQNEQLFKAYKTLHDSEGFNALAPAQQQIVRNNLRDFKLSGIDLDENARHRYGELKQRLSEASNQFSNNVLDATQAWTRHVVDLAELEGMPDAAITAAKAAAQAKQMEGYLLTLDAPCYIAVVSYADSAGLRKDMYTAYTTRASDKGPNAGEFSNSDLMVEITTLRHELATLLGFANYAEYSLAKKMADTPDQVIDFLEQLSGRTRAVAQSELEALQQYASAEHQHVQLEAWDVSYFSEKLRKQQFDIDQEELRPYFPAQKVTQGLFSVASRLFDIEITPDASMSTWHSDVSAFQISRNGSTIARFYLDLYAREHKRGGAWMADCRVRRRLNSGGLQNPVAFLTCNFMAPAGGQPSLLTFNEVTTLFHEFGHGLHHMLSQIEYAEVSGINGVAWDAVELPSQFLENWCWQAQVIEQLSEHHETGESLPQELLNKLLAAKNFQAGMQMLRQIEFALFDFRMHQQSGMQSADDIQALLNQVRADVAVLTPPADNRFQHGFSHIFAGGYAAGYYSYKWAEVLSADAFSEFEEHGIYHDATRKRYLSEILEKGGAAPAMELFKNFMGREPEVDALLKQSGIAA